MAVLLPRNDAKQIFLNQVAVLILVRQNLRKVLPVLQRYLAGANLPSLPVHQNVQRKMLHIGKVDDLPFTLFLLHAPVKIQRQIKQDRRRLPARGRLPCRQLQGRGKKPFNQPLDAVLHLGAEVLGKLPFRCRNAVVLFGGQPSEADRRQLHLIVGQGPAAGQPHKLLQLPLHQLPVHIRAVRCLTQVLHPGQLFRAAADSAVEIFQEPAAVIAAADFLHRGGGVIRLTSLQPFPGEGEAGGIAGQVQYMLLQHLLPAPGAEIFHAIPERLAPRLIALLHQLGKSLLLHQLNLPLVRDAEGRVKPDLIEMVAQKIQAEAVYGGDLGIVYQGGLLLDMLGLRIPGKPPCDAVRNPLPHFRRRRVGKGHDEKPVDIHRCLPVAHPFHNALRQHRRLAAACRRRHQYIAVL